MRDILSILLTLLYVFLASALSEARSCVAMALDIVAMEASLVRLTPADQTLLGFFDSTGASRFYSGTDHSEQPCAPDRVPPAAFWFCLDSLVLSWRDNISGKHMWSDVGARGSA